MADDFIFTSKETVARHEDEIKRLEKFRNLVYRIASVRMDTDKIIREAKQCIADYEDHLFMDETSKDLFDEIDRMESE
jgi:hypothetical protein